MCGGYTPVMVDDKTTRYSTEKEAQAELDSDEEFYEDCFVCEYEEIGHKIIYTGENNV